MKIPWIVVLLGALAVGACGREAAPEGAYAVRDSAGVQIVSNPSAVVGDSACPVVDSVPAFTIGGAEAQGPYDVGRVTGVRRLPDGSVLVLNGTTSELRIFDSTGHYLRSAGRKGSGPGEFQSPYHLGWYGPDTLMVQDFGTSRLTLLGTDGSLLLQVGGFVSPGQGTTGRQRSPTRLVRVSRAGAVLDTLGVFPGSENVSVVTERTAFVMQATFGRSTTFAVADSLVYVGDNDRYRVLVYAGGRRLVRVITRTQRPGPVTPAMAESVTARSNRATANPRFREMQEQARAADKLPATLPAYRSIAPDADGWLWVRPYSDTRDGALPWDVFDATGRLRCAVRLPADFAAQEIGHAHLTGVARDEDGVEQVRAYRVRRITRSPS